MDTKFPTASILPPRATTTPTSPYYPKTNIRTDYMYPSDAQISRDCAASLFPRNIFSFRRSLFFFLRRRVFFLSLGTTSSSSSSYSAHKVYRYIYTCSRCAATLSQGRAQKSPRLSATTSLLYIASSRNGILFVDVRGTKVRTLFSAIRTLIATCGFLLS